MSLKSRLNNLEQNIKPKEKDPAQDWNERLRRQEEIDSLSPAIEQGNLQACIRYCELSEETILDTLYSYRDVYIKVAAESRGEEPNYTKQISMDIWYQNLKATYRYLKEKAVSPDTKEPILKVWQSQS
ncbi:hypothetical protein ACTQ5K_22485 [Niallia sp. Sow4_A1]|uniref:hypothetical protein n=1 Tax=unclassified Niallia TaxID=2837522 RepID=UPI00203CD88E|nr:hypothetical protein [Niallia sp. MER TA 168]MCM3364743.1 hypothetical protein [Niallia sp. MER TA 168]